MKRLSTFCIFLCLIIIFSSAPVSAVSQAEIAALEAQRDELRQAHEDMQEQLEAMQTDRDNMMERKAALDQQSELLRQDIELLTQQIALYGELVDQSRTQAEEAAKAEREQYELYCERLRDMEEHSFWSYFSILTGVDSLAEFLALLNDIFDIMNYDRVLWENYLEAKQQAEDTLAQYRDVLSSQEDKYAELTQQQKLLAEKIEASSALIAELGQDIDAYMEFYEASEEELERVQQLIDEKEEELRQQQAAAAPGISAGTAVGGYYAWPSYCGYISSPFGPRTHPIYGQLRPHTGVDIAAAYGTAITAAAEGVVTMAVVDYGSVGYGSYVAIYHPNGSTTLYAHMSALAVSVGQSVSQGQLIGYVGSTGASTGPHIHFEIRSGGICVDPMLYF